MGYFSLFFGSPRRVTEKSPKIPPRSPPRALRGPPRDPEIDQLFASGGPGVQPIICFGSPGRPQEPFGALLAPTLGPHGARKRPGGLQAFIFDPPGPPWGAFFYDFHVFFHMVFFMFYCAVLFACSSACSSSRPFFGNLQVEKIKVESPGSLNPWVAAGGREAIRINKRRFL